MDELPAKIAKEDRLELLLAAERTARLRAEIGRLQAELSYQLKNHQELAKWVMAKYSMREIDSFDNETGDILRVKNA